MTFSRYRKVKLVKHHLSKQHQITPSASDRERDRPTIKLSWFLMIFMRVLTPTNTTFPLSQCHNGKLVINTR